MVVLDYSCERNGETVNLTENTLENSILPFLFVGTTSKNNQLQNTSLKQIKREAADSMCVGRSG